MKVILVSNQHDFPGTQRVQDAVKDLIGEDRIKQAVAKKANGEEVPAEDLEPFDGEVHLVDFMAVRDLLPIRATPCVLFLFDELEENFDPKAVRKTARVIKQTFGA